jgi:hypothetical protein
MRPQPAPFKFDVPEIQPHRPAAAPAAAGWPLLVGRNQGTADGGEWGAGWVGGFREALAAGAGDDPFHEDWRHWAGR